VIEHLDDERSGRADLAIQLDTADVALDRTNTKTI